MGKPVTLSLSKIARISKNLERRNVVEDATPTSGTCRREHVLILDSRNISTLSVVSYSHG